MSIPLQNNLCPACGNIFLLSVASGIVCPKCGLDLTMYSIPKGEQPMNIDKPGFYRTSNGSKAEVVEVRDSYAIGFGGRCGQVWLTDGRHWNWATGSDGSNPQLNIVSEWREPVTKTATIVLCRGCNGSPYVAFDVSKVDRQNVLARKNVAITEGEGMT